MPRFVVRLAFAALFVVLIASLVALVRSQSAVPPEETPYLLALPDLTSPRATLETLMVNGDIAKRSVLTYGVPWAPTPAMLRMMDTVDVSAAATAGRELEAALAAAQIKDVLDHIALPPLSDIPDADAVRAQGITEWRLPGTPIVIAKLASGPRAGAFLFSQQTVELADQLYRAVRDLAYRGGQHSTVYEEWRYMPGPLLPRAVIASLPAPFRIPVFGQAIWQWIGLFLLLAVDAIVTVQIIGWGIQRDARAASIAQRYGQPTAALAVIALSFATLALSEYALKLWGGPLEALLFFLQLTAIAGLAWFAVTAIRRSGELIIAAYAMHETNIDAQLVKVISTLLATAAGVAAGFYAADFVGIPVGPLLAGLGIGGLAVALAVRPTLENIIGGLTLFADRPARVGEYCRFGAESGTVEAIGLRTTKIRRRDDTIVTISNAELAQARIENYSRRRKFRFNPLLRLRYETTAKQLAEIATGITATLKQHGKVLEDTERVRLSSLGDYALELEVDAYIDVTSNREFTAVKEELNLSILAIVSQAGAAFALPSQTNYLARDAAPVAAGQIADVSLGVAG